MQLLVSAFYEPSRLSTTSEPGSLQWMSNTIVYGPMSLLGFLSREQQPQALEQPGK